MSAYAYPGLLPPLAFQGNDFVSTEIMGSTNSPSECGKIEGSLFGPLHQQSENSAFAGLLKASVDLLSVPTFGRSKDASKTANNCGDSRSSSSEDTRSEDPGIAVREAKIDPVRLIQCVTGSLPRSSQTQSRKTLRRRGSRERLLAEASPPSSPNSRKQTIGCGDNDEKMKSKTSVLPPGPKGSPHDEAIEFELSISLNGRKYTATRTLQCIMQLRDDLIREMDARRQWHNIQKAASHAFSSSPKHFGDEDAPSSSSTDCDVDIQIPEIPPMTGEESNGSSGFVGRGFTMLHAMATSYVPVMERWLRNVMAIVPQDSESLTNFLWEPISNVDFPLDLPTKSCNSLATLRSIKELDYDTGDEDDSEDEDEDNW